VSLAAGGCTAVADIAKVPPVSDDASAPDVRVAAVGADASRPDVVAVEAGAGLADVPLRILFVCDIEGSMAITDPPPDNCGQEVCLTRRAQAIVETMQRYPPGGEVKYGIISFAATGSILTTDAAGDSGFTTDKSQVSAVVPSLSAVFGQSGYDSALGLAFEMMQADMNTLGASRGRARYEIVFMSDGTPEPDVTAPGQSIPPDVELDVENIVGLQTAQQVALVSLNTVYFNAANTPVSAELQAGSLMQAMASLANGQYREVESNESLDLSYIDFTGGS